MPRYLNQKKTLQYSREFKIKAVKLSLQDHMQVQQVAANLDIHPFMLSRWRKEYREGKFNRSGRVTVSPKNEKPKKSKKPLSEVAKLKREIAQLKEENDLLKKWQRYLAEERENDSNSSTDTDN